jgi:hypothetical protein
LPEITEKTMKNNRKHLLLGLALTTTLACSATKEDEEDALEGVPEQAALELALTGDAASEGLATDADAITGVTDSLERAGEGMTIAAAPGLAQARGAIKELNQSLRDFFQPVVALVRDAEPTSTEGAVRTWGPITRGATEFRFVLQRGVARRYGWQLQARPAGSDADFTSVAAGGISVGYQVRRGHGTVGLDLHALAAVDPTLGGTGQLLAGFAHGPRGSMLSYALRDFTPNAALHAPIGALIHGVYVTGGDSKLRLAYHGNMAETASDAEELILARVRHRRDLGGRADVVAMGGDVAEGKAWLISECWGAELGSTYRIVRECQLEAELGQHCEPVSKRGDAGECPRHLLVEEFAPSDPEQTMPEPESPEQTEPPATLPDGTPPRG